MASSTITCRSSRSGAMSPPVSKVIPAVTPPVACCAYRCRGSGRPTLVQLWSGHRRSAPELRRVSLPSRRRHRGTHSPRVARTRDILGHSGSDQATNAPHLVLIQRDGDLLRRHTSYHTVQPQLATTAIRPCEQCSRDGKHNRLRRDSLPGGASLEERHSGSNLTEGAAKLIRLSRASASAARQSAAIRIAGAVSLVRGCCRVNIGNAISWRLLATW